MANKFIYDRMDTHQSKPLESNNKPFESTNTVPDPNIKVPSNQILHLDTSLVAEDDDLSPPFDTMVQMLRDHFSISNDEATQCLKKFDDYAMASWYLFQKKSKEKLSVNNNNNNNNNTSVEDSVIITNNQSAPANSSSNNNVIPIPSSNAMKDNGNIQGQDPKNLPHNSSSDPNGQPSFLLNLPFSPVNGQLYPGTPMGNRPPKKPTYKGISQNHPRYYVIRGHRAGIYFGYWEQLKVLVENFPQAQYYGYDELEEARNHWMRLTGLPPPPVQTVTFEFDPDNNNFDDSTPNSNISALRTYNTPNNTTIPNNTTTTTSFFGGNNSLNLSAMAKEQIKVLPKFDGKKSFSRWYNVFASVLNQSGIVGELQYGYFFGKLDDEPKKVCESFLEAGKSYSNIVTEFRRIYDSKDVEEREQMLERKPGESITTFAFQLRSIREESEPNITEKRMNKILWRRLDPAIKDIVRVYIDICPTYVDFVQKIREIEEERKPSTANQSILVHNIEEEESDDSNSDNNNNDNSTSETYAIQRDRGGRGFKHFNKKKFNPSYGRCKPEQERRRDDRDRDNNNNNYNNDSNRSYYNSKSSPQRGRGFSRGNDSRSRGKPYRGRQEAIYSIESAKSNPLRVMGFVGGKISSILFDSGSGYTFVSDTIHRDVLRNAKLEKANLEYIKGVGGQLCKILGQLSVPFEVGGIKFNANAKVVCNLGQAAIVGMDVMHEIGLEIDCNKRWLRCNDKIVPYENSRQDKYPSVMVAESITVPAGARLEVSLRVKGKKNALGLVRERTDVVNERGIVLPSGIVALDEDEETVALVWNTTALPVELSDGDAIGVWEPVAVEELADMEDLLDTTEVFAVDAKEEPLSKEDKILLEKVRQMNSRVREVNDRQLLALIKQVLNMDLDTDTDISNKQKKIARDFFLRNIDVFSWNPSAPRCTTATTHKIDTGDSKPVKRLPYRYNPKDQEIIKKFVNEMLEGGIIAPSNSPWSFPVVLVNKADGGIRFCVDYRRLNEITRKDSYAIPNIGDILDKIAGCKYYWGLDLANGYWQIPMDPADADKTTFTTSFGTYKFLRMPFGVCNGPATFQRMMDEVLRNVKVNVVSGYIDDINGGSMTFSACLTDLEQVFAALRKNNLAVKLSKCKFFKLRMPVLGYIVNANGVEVDPKKVEDVKKMPAPTTIKSLQRFLGMCNYYRQFIYRFADIAHSLYDLTRKSKKWKWEQVHQDAFELLKKKLTEYPVIRHPDYRRPFIISTDASDYGISAILSQLDKDGREYVVRYASKGLEKAERNWTVTERECWAVVWGCNQFDMYIRHSKFTIYTDHSALQWLNRNKNTHGKLGRWAISLGRYNYDIIHRKGTMNVVADCLSRNMEEPEPNLNETVAALLDVEYADEDFVFAVDGVDIKKEQASDEFCKEIIRGLNGEEVEKKFKKDLKSFELSDGMLYRVATDLLGVRRQDVIPRLVVPKTLVSQVLSGCHDDIAAGHVGVNRTKLKTRERFWWVSMDEDIRKWVRMCEKCNRRKGSPKKHGPLMPIEAKYPFELLSMDLLGPLPATECGNRYIIVFTDHFTRWMETAALPSMDAEVVAQTFVNKIITRHGVPTKLLTDRGAQFLSILMKEVYQLCGIKKINTTPYHPQTDGMTERNNKKLCDSLACYVAEKQKNWDVLLPFVTFALNTSVNRMTGEVPFFLIYGRDALLPIQYNLDSIPAGFNGIEDYRTHLVTGLRRVRENVTMVATRNRQEMERLYNLGKENSDLRVGDLVLMYRPTNKVGISPKLDSPWQGPARVLEKTSPVNFKIRFLRAGNEQIIHANLLKKYYGILPEDEKAYEELRKVTTESTPMLRDEGNLLSDATRIENSVPEVRRVAESNGNSNQQPVRQPIIVPQQTIVPPQPVEVQQQPTIVQSTNEQQPTVQPELQQQESIITQPIATSIPVQQDNNINSSNNDNANVNPVTERRYQTRSFTRVNPTPTTNNTLSTTNTSNSNSSNNTNSPPNSKSNAKTTKILKRRTTFNHIEYLVQEDSKKPIWTPRELVNSELVNTFERSRR